MAHIGMIPAELRPDSNPDPGIRALDYVALPISEITGGDRRLEAETYLSDGYMVRRAIQRSNLPTPQLAGLAKIWQPNRLKGIQVAPEHGVPYLLATQVFDIWPRPRKWLAPSKIPDVDRLYVDRGWILVTRSGTVGNPIVTYTPHVGRIVSDDLLRVEIEGPNLRGYVYAFLRTWLGRAMTRSSQYGSAVKHLEVNHLAETPVPVLDRLLDELGGEIAETYTMRDEAYRLDMASRSRFAEALNDRPEVPREQGYVVSASHLFNRRRRIEAYAHSPSSRFVSEVYERNAESIVALGDVARVYAPGRFKRIYGDTGTPYLDSESVFKTNPEITKFLTQATAVRFSDYRVKAGWLLMACSGQIYGLNGSVCLMTKWHENHVVTHDMIRIVPRADRVRPGYLQAALGHPDLGRPLILRNAYGTSIPHLDTSDIAQTPVVRLGAIEDEIADTAEQASELRRKADEIENRAVFRLEDQLEKALGISRDKKQFNPPYPLEETQSSWDRPATRAADRFPN